MIKFFDDLLPLRHFRLGFFPKKTLSVSVSHVKSHENYKIPNEPIEVELVYKLHRIFVPKIKFRELTSKQNFEQGLFLLSSSKMGR